MTIKTKKCNKCNKIKNLDCFSKSPTPSNPDYIRAECKECRNKARRKRNKETGYYKKKYQSMSDEEKKKYIKKKSLQNQKRLREKSGERERRKKWQKSDKGVYSSYRTDCNRRGRKARNIEMLLKFEEFKLLINEKCFYCGKNNCRGVDRVNSEESYTKENCVPCCNICNQMKNNLSQEDFYTHIETIFNNIKK